MDRGWDLDLEPKKIVGLVFGFVDHHQYLGYLPGTVGRLFLS